MNKQKKAANIPYNKPINLFEKTENWLMKNNIKFFYFLIFLCLLLSFISFNARISEAHDDALYLEGGWRFVNEFPEYFYTANAPLYPMFLALLVKLMGFKLIIFKLFSVLFNLLGLVLFYKALYKRIPAVVFIPVMIFQASNYLSIYFASMTFTEAFYFFLQGLFFFYSAKIINLNTGSFIEIRSQLKTWFMFGFSMFLLSTCKSSAIIVVPAVAMYFIFVKNWKGLGLGLGSYFIFKVLYEIVVKLIWHGQSQFKDQSGMVFLKDPYNRELGNEDLSGFVQRFIDNCNLYLSKRFYQIIGWRDENNAEVYGFISIITIALIVIGFWFFIKKKNNLLILLTVFSCGQAVLSFVTLAARWDQPRIVLVTMPIILTAILYALYQFTNKPGMGPTVFASLILILVSSIIISSFRRGLVNLPIVQKNLKGDKYYGYTPDWVNFLKCSEWCADSLSKETLVASRKAPMSFVYGKGKKFFPIYSVIKRDSVTERSNPDSALAFFQKNKITHVMLASLRANPANASDGFITTMHYIMAPIAQKYPEKLKLVHVEGAFEECSLYEIKY